MDLLPALLPKLIPILAVAMALGTGMLALWLDHERRMKLLELHHRERVLAMERGIELPPLPLEALSSWPGRRRAAGPAHRSASGLALLLGGLALGTALWLNLGREAAAWALIPVAVGIAWLTTQPRTPADDAALKPKAGTA